MAGLFLRLGEGTHRPSEINQKNSFHPEIIAWGGAPAEGWGGKGK